MTSAFEACGVDPRINPDAARAEPLDFVTVVFSAEIGLLKLQAMSFAACLEPECVGTIHLIINDPYPGRCESIIEEGVLPLYGRHAGRVRVWQGDALVGRPADGLWNSWKRLGWYRQQLLKLVIAMEISSNLYVVLDSKNHLIRKMGYWDFLPDGERPRSWWVRVDGPLADFYANSMAAFKLEKSTNLSKVMPAVTPYMLWTKLVREMMGYISEESGEAFCSYFMKPGRNLSEFFLYYGYLRSLKLNIECLYQFLPTHAATLFRHWANDREKEARLMKKILQPNIFFFGLHRNCLPISNPATKEAIVTEWVRAGIFNERSSADDFIEEELSALRH